MIIEIPGLKPCDGPTWTCPSRRLISRVISVYSSSAPSQPCTGVSPSLVCQCHSTSFAVHVMPDWARTPAHKVEAVSAGHLHTHLTMTHSHPRPSMKVTSPFPKAATQHCCNALPRAQCVSMHSVSPQAAPVAPDAVHHTHLGKLTVRSTRDCPNKKPEPVPKAAPCTHLPTQRLVRTLLHLLAFPAWCSQQPGSQQPVQQL